MKQIILLFCVLFSTRICHANSNLWEYIAENFQLDHQAYREEVKQQITWFQSHQTFLQNVTRQAKPYMYYITQIVESRHLPGELVLLPIIESAYDPFAHSWVGAAGLWQFMPATASGIGVKQNWWYDGRRDIIASTDAALNYLSYLNRLFHHNWSLAVAGYNCGEGNVQRAIRYNQNNKLKTDFWSLKLPYETRSYVPRLLALAEIVQHPQKYHIHLDPIPLNPYFSEVDVGFQINLAKAAKMANISLNELYLLNPGYNRWSTDPDGPHTLLLPIANLSAFENNLVKQTGKHSKMMKHTVQQEETLEAISRQYYTTAHAIRLANHLQQQDIIPKQVLLIPQNTYYISPLQHVKNTKKSYTTPENLHHYIVKSGDTLWKIAGEYHVSINQLKLVNNGLHTVLQPGQTLQIPV